MHRGPSTHAPCNDDDDDDDGGGGGDDRMIHAHPAGSDRQPVGSLGAAHVL